MPCDSHSVAGRTGVITLTSSDISDLGNSATKNIGTAANTVAAGNDTRIVNAIQNEGSDSATNVISMSSGLDANKATSGWTAGRIYLATDAQKIYRDNGSSWDLLSSATGSGGTLTSVTATSPIASSGGTTPQLSLTSGSALGQTLRWNGSNWLAALLSSSDISGLGALATKASVDLSSSDATGVLAAARMPALTGDVTNTVGTLATTVAKIQNRAVTNTQPSDGQALVWDDTNTTWKPLHIRMQDIRNSWGGSQMIPGANCGANESMVWNSITDTFTCQGIGSLDASKMTSGVLNSARLPAASATTDGIVTQSAQSFSGAKTFANDMTLQNGLNVSGNVGIGTTNPNAKLEVVGSIMASGAVSSNNIANSLRMEVNAGAQRILSEGPDTSTRGTFSFAQAASDASLYNVPMYINSTGNIGIGTTAPAYTLDITGTMRVTGQAYSTTGNGSFTIPSDARFKDVHGSYDRGLNDLLSVDPIRYNYLPNNPFNADPNQE